MTNNSLVLKIVNRYIGVSGGYLGDFSYRTHAEFYLEYCNLQNKDPDSIDGTTRTRFISIFNSSTDKEKAAIIRGVVDKFPVGTGPATRTKILRDQLLYEATKLEKSGILDGKQIVVSSEAVHEALDDAKTFIKEGKALSAVDRLHTVFHGYLRELCNRESIAFVLGDDLVSLTKKLFSEHAQLNSGNGQADISNIARSISSISNSLNPIRNSRSLAHPNEQLLQEPEAMLVVNTIYTLLTYLESKIGEKEVTF